MSRRSADAASLYVDMQSVRARLAIAAGETITLCEMQIAGLGPSGRRSEDTLDCSAVDPRAAARGGLQVSVEQACDILRIWQANRSWIAMAIEDNLALVNCGGFLRDVGPGGLRLSDAQASAVRLWLTLHRTANYEHRVGENEIANEPYETLEIHFGDCLAYLGAYRAQPKEPVWLLL